MIFLFWLAPLIAVLLQVVDAAALSESFKQSLAGTAWQQPPSRSGCQHRGAADRHCYGNRFGSVSYRWAGAGSTVDAWRIADAVAGDGDCLANVAGQLGNVCRRRAGRCKLAIVSTRDVAVDGNPRRGGDSVGGSDRGGDFAKRRSQS